MDESALIKQNYEAAMERVQQAAVKAGRASGSVRLVVVTKGHPISKVRAAFDAGARVFGENYAEEGISKILALAELTGVQWHMIGHIQSRKAGSICEYFDYVHSVDSLKLANRLNRFAAEKKRVIPVLLEQNMSGEPSKSGFASWEEARWDELSTEIEAILSLEHLSVRGFMTIPPYTADPEEARPYFQRLRCLRDFLSRQFQHASFDELSMGMSADFEIAIQEGATIVRVGQAILGPRL